MHDRTPEGSSVLPYCTPTNTNRFSRLIVPIFLGLAYHCHESQQDIQAVAPVQVGKGLSPIFSRRLREVAGATRLFRRCSLGALHADVLTGAARSPLADIEGLCRVVPVPLRLLQQCVGRFSRRLEANMPCITIATIARKPNEFNGNGGSGCLVRCEC